MKDQNLSGIIKNACIVTFSDSLPSYSHLQFLYGTVVEDFKHRFDSGTEFRSSIVTSIDGDIVTTQNSIYQVQGEIEVVDLPIKSLQYVLEYINPHIAKELFDKGLTCIPIEDPEKGDK